MLLRICSRSIRFFPKRQEQNDPARQLFPLLPATARYLRIDRSMQKNRPHDPASTTARSGLNDRTIRPQRPHDPGPATARCQIVLLHDAADTKTRCFASEKSLSFTKYLKIVSPQRIREAGNTHFLELRKDRYRSNFADEKQ